ncbi:MAG: hypothetical protein AABW50_02395 [Nanoarchaeota archaeon]
MKLCESVNPIEVYEGRNVDAMPKLLADGRVPMSTVQLMIYRIGQSDAFSEWETNYFDTSDLIAYDAKDNGKAKFILTVNKDGKIADRKTLELINPDSKLISGALELGDNYSALNGIEVARGNLGEIEKYMTKDEILGNKVWRILARHPDEVPAEFAEDPQLLGEYVSWVQSQTNNENNMTVYVDSLGKSPKFRAWCVDRLDNGSSASGRIDLGNDGGRFVGIAPEAPNARILRPTLEQSLSIVNQNLERLEIRRK